MEAINRAQELLAEMDLYYDLPQTEVHQLLREVLIAYDNLKMENNKLKEDIDFLDSLCKETGEREDL